MLKILAAFNTETERILNLLEGHDVHKLAKGDSMVAAVSRGDFHLVLVEGAVRILADIKSADPRTEVVLIGRAEDDEVEAVRNGAFAFLRLPIDDRQLLEIIDDIDKTFMTRCQLGELEEQIEQRYVFSGIVGRNPKMLEIISFIKRIAPYYKTVTIMGETGTGKEVVARALHYLSSKRGDPFVTSNCAGYVETLIESELFGHKKGSFTGATSDKVGLFEAAREGTLFLDEIGDLPLSFQPHLLRVLQNGEFRPVGSHRTLQARCRIIAATSRDLEKEVLNGKFREDLFYRITPLAITVPPLRERKDDILLLSQFLLKRYCDQMKKEVRGISRPAQDILLAHGWPGNVRELENAMSQAVMLTDKSFIDPGYLPAYLKNSKVRVSHESFLDGVIKRHIEIVLEECRGNRSHASKKLGISRRSLLRKIEKYAIK